MKIRLSISQLFVAILVVSLFVMATRAVLDADFWWHLRTGQWIIENRAIPHADPFSLSFQGKPWIAHEWLSEIFFYTGYRTGGLNMLALTFAGVITIAYFLSYWRSSGKPYLAGIVTIFGAIASAPVWGVRPQMLTLLLFSIWIFLLERYFDSGNKKIIIFLPLIMILWVNLHAGYILGLALLAIYIFLKMIEGYLPSTWAADKTTNPNRGLLLPALAGLVACCIAVLINPNGYEMFMYPFGTLGSQAMMTLISEWLSPNFHSREWMPLALFLIILLAGGLFSRRRSSLTDIALAGIFGFAALRSMRNVPLFAIVAIPIISFQLDGIIHYSANRKEPTKIINFVNSSILIIVMLAGLAQVSTTLLNQNKSELEVFPETSVNWIKENNPEGNIFNSYGWGGFLIWHLYPNYKVYVDGRADLYGDTYLQDFVTIYQAKPGWEAKLEKAKIKIALVETDSPIANALSKDSNWKIQIKNNLESLFTRQ
jgi:hypothetical protein